jgi:hypothetical protein
MAEKYDSYSPYHFSGNNPILFIDDNGMDWYSYTDDDGNDHYKYQDGSGNNSLSASTAVRKLKTVCCTCSGISGKQISRPGWDRLPSYTQNKSGQV